MRPGDVHHVEVTSEQLGYLAMACRQALTKDRKGARKFGDDLDPDSSLAHRLRVGYDVEDIMVEALEAADEKGDRDEE